MRTITTTATILPDGTIIARGPADLPPGEHAVVIVVEELSARAERRFQSPLQLVMLPWACWPPDATFRREALYGDDGR